MSGRKMSSENIQYGVRSDAIENLTPVSHKAIQDLTKTWPSSEIISEAIAHSSDKTNRAIVPDKETDELIEEVIVFAEEFSPAYEKLRSIIDRNRSKIILLKSTFGVYQGRAGHTVLIRKEPLTWDQFVRKYFSVTPRRLNQLLQPEADEHETKEGELTLATEKRNPIPEAEKPAYKRGRAAGFAEAQRQTTARLLMSGASGSVPDPKNESFLYFNQFKSEKEKFTVEVVEMVLTIYEPDDARKIGVLFARELERQVNATMHRSLDLLNHPPVAEETR